MELDLTKEWESCGQDVKLKWVGTGGWGSGGREGVVRGSWYYTKIVSQVSGSDLRGQCRVKAQNTRPDQVSGVFVQLEGWVGTEVVVPGGSPLLVEV